MSTAQPRPLYAEQTHEDLIPDFCRALRATAFAVVTRDGALREANRAFVELLPSKMPILSVLDIRGLFVCPQFGQLCVRRGDPSTSIVYQGILDFGDARERVASLHATVYERDKDLFLVAEQDVGMLEQQQRKLLEPNELLTKRQRKLSRLLGTLLRHENIPDVLKKDISATLREGSQ